jgi:2-dehydro-3-deoxyphosphogluconate aldolase/(4S)-4-hydroxy-2-oxoglutarate aldolase
MIAAAGLVPVVELPAAQQATALLDALVAGGLPVAEITLRTDAAFDAIALLRRSHPDAVIGAGTVRTVDAAERSIEAGAQFIVSPSTSVEVIELCSREGVAVVPGACTPTEIDTALGAGARLVKLFPVEAIGGIRFLKALVGPYRDVRFVPTGGINATNLPGYLGIPQVAACGGSWIVTPELLREARYEEVTRLTREAVAIIAGVRGK